MRVVYAQFWSECMGPGRVELYIVGLLSRAQVGVCGDSTHFAVELSTASVCETRFALWCQRAALLVIVSAHSATSMSGSGAYTGGFARGLCAFPLLLKLCIRFVCSS